MEQSEIIELGQWDVLCVQLHASASDRSRGYLIPPLTASVTRPLHQLLNEHRVTPLDQQSAASNLALIPLVIIVGV
jgi:hypothetical protein